MHSILLFAQVFVLTLMIETTLLLSLMIVGNSIVRGCQEYDSNKESFSKWLLIKSLLLKSKFDGTIPVVLIDYKDNLYITIANNVDDSDVLSSFVYYFTQVGPLCLHPDGTVTSPEYKHCYIYNWLPIDVEKRTWMLLQGSRGFDF